LLLWSSFSSIFFFIIYVIIAALTDPIEEPTITSLGFDQTVGMYNYGAEAINSKQDKKQYIMNISSQILFKPTI